MLGQGYNAGQGILNPQRGLSAEADLPIAQDSLDRLGARLQFASTWSIPWAWTRCALGIQKGYAGANTTTNRWGYSDALLNVSNKPAEINSSIQVPEFIFTNQLPANTFTGQTRRLPLQMVAPQLAWKPG